MGSNIINICKNIQHGKLLEESLPRLFNALADSYQIQAEVRLAMHYFTLYEAYYDDENTWGREALEEIDDMNQILFTQILQKQSGEEREQAIYQIDLMRNKLTQRMNVLTYYADLFQIFEYVLNRVEYRFDKQMMDVDDTEFSKDILRFIFETEDNFIINERIKEIIGQLPIRITKQKYFELLKDSLMAYLGTEGDSLNTFLYMIRTSAMLYGDKDMESLYPGLWEKKEYFLGLNYKELTEDEFEKALSTFQAAILTLDTEISVYMSLQEIVNDSYALLLCSPYAGMSGSSWEKAQKSSHEIIQKINDLFLKKEKIELAEELFELFSDLEGVQEEVVYDAVRMENALYEAENNYADLIDSLMLETYKNILIRTQKLLSNSLFIDLKDGTENALVDEARIEKEYARLETELRSLFTQYDRMIGRAVMANTINKLPVFFKDHMEVMDYVCYSLERCTDIYEKAACIEIISEIMSQ